VNTRDRFFTIGIAVLLLCIAAVVIFKFVLPRKPVDSFHVNKTEQLTVVDLDGNEIKFSDILSKDESSYCLLFSLKDCYSCIFRGLEDLTNLRRAGKNCFGLVIDDNYKDVDIWAANYEFTPFLVLKRVDFYEHIKSVVTPVLVKFENGNVDSFKYIMPN